MTLSPVAGSGGESSDSRQLRKSAISKEHWLHKSIAIETANAIRFCNPQARRMPSEQIHCVNGRLCKRTLRLRASSRPIFGQGFSSNRNFLFHYASNADVARGQHLVGNFQSIFI
jgi:hypothetical protein